MSMNPLNSPQTNVEQQNGPFEAPQEVLTKIRQATIAGQISGGITLLLTLLAIFAPDVTGFVDAWNLIDVALIFGLAFGIHKKSRACALGLLVYFTFSKIYIYTQTGKPTGLIFALIFLYYYARGVQGTFQYHKLKKQHAGQ